MVYHRLLTFCDCLINFGEYWALIERRPTHGVTAMWEAMSWSHFVETPLETWRVVAALIIYINIIQKKTPCSMIQIRRRPPPNAFLK